MVDKKKRFLSAGTVRKICRNADTKGVFAVVQQRHISDSKASFLRSLVLYIITFEFFLFLPCLIIDHRPFFRASTLPLPH